MVKWGLGGLGLVGTIALGCSFGTGAVAQTGAASGAAYRLEGLALRQQGDLAGAIGQFRRAVEQEPQNLDGQVLLGWTLHLAGEGTAAAQVLEGALHQDPVHVPSLNALGIVYLVQGRLWRSVVTHGQGVVLDPGNEVAFYNLSLAFERLGLGEWAVGAAEAAIDREPYNPHPYVALALAQWGRGDRSGALAAYGEALGLDGRYGDRVFLDHLREAGFSADQVLKTEEILRNF
ncbi:MAG: tetratricopeptide repeat protein [Prochlorothrix sp.]